MSELIKAHKTLKAESVAQKRAVHHSFFPIVSGYSSTDVTVSQPSIQRNIVDPPPTSKDQDVVQQDLEREYQRGFEAGSIETEKRLRQEFESRLAREKQELTALMESMGNQLAQYQERAEGIALALAFDIAKLIVKREVELDDQNVLRQIREALSRVLGVERIKLRVNPRDEATVREHRAAILSSSDSIREVLVESDEKIEAGGCVIESDTGNVDARLSTQLKQIEAALFEQSSRL